jgi:hypothetical protein
MEFDVLFLDIDGVLDPSETQHPHVFAPGCVSQLKRLLAVCPQVKVVFPTTWRLGVPFFALGWLWRQHELPLRVVMGRTSDIDPSRRGDEVRKWLEDSRLMFPGCKLRRYAAVDDEPEPLLQWLRAETVFCCNSREGLDELVTKSPH